jgi:hypothetical protein
MRDAVLRDLAFGLRTLRRRPGVSVLVLLCLGLGIGATTAVASWVEGILLRPYPAVAHQERLYALIGTDRGTGGFDDLSWPDFVDLRAESRLVESFVGDKITGATLGIGDHARRATGSIVSASYFDALGVRPALGRGFLPEEERGNDAHPVTVISDTAWREVFGSDPHVLGRVQRLDGIDHTIVGVAPPEFLGTFVGYRIDFWVPASMEEAFGSVGKLDDRGARWIEGYVRLRPGVSPAQAQQELSAIAARTPRAIRRPTAAAACASSRSGRRRSTRRARCAARSASRPRRWASCCSSPAPMSPTCWPCERSVVAARWRCAWRSAAAAAGSSCCCSPRRRRSACWRPVAACWWRVCAATC